MLIVHRRVNPRAGNRAIVDPFFPPEATESATEFDGCVGYRSRATLFCMQRTYLLPLLILGAGRAQTDEPRPARELIEGIKDYESTLGFTKTHNFDRDSATLRAYYRCYYTEPLQLPESYDKLKLREGAASGCSIDPRKYDVFFYGVEAVASGKTPVTTTLKREPPERVLVVVPHEDFHMCKDLPPAVAEAAATLIGFLAAADYAHQAFGPDSPVYRNLAGEPERFLDKALLVNRYYDELFSVYQRRRNHEISSPEAFAVKNRLFAQLRAECQAMPDAHSFNKCLGADNNAGLAFDRTYTRFYPLLYQLYQARGRDVRATIESLDELLKPRSLSEEEAAGRIRTAAALHSE
jgi:hypothetical protein